MSGRALPHRRLIERTVPPFACRAFCPQSYGYTARPFTVLDAPAWDGSTTRVRSGYLGTRSQRGGTP